MEVRFRRSRRRRRSGRIARCSAPSRVSSIAGAVPVLEIARNVGLRGGSSLCARRRQHGVVASAQLLAAGVGRDVIAAPGPAAAGCGDSIAGSISSARSRPHTHARWPRSSPPARARSSPTTQPPFSGSCARPRDGPMDVTIAGGRRNAPGIRIHRATLHPHDITRRHGIPVTSAARTLLDLAATAPRRDLERAVNEAHMRTASARIPSMSSSAVTHATEERRH